MNTSDKLRLVEAARVEFENKVKAALSTDDVRVTVTIYTAANMFKDAPQEWSRDGSENLIWARSTFMGTSVFGEVEK